MRKRFIFALIILLVIFGGTFIYDGVKSYFIKQYFAHYEVPAVTVSTVKVVSKNWQPTLIAVGTVTAANGVDINSRVDGQITAIYFRSGQMVNAGQSLIQLDDALDRQNYITDDAQYNLDLVTYQRQAKLLTTHAAAQNDVDVARAKMLQSQATVAKDQLNILYKNIKAPFAGKVGIRTINLGQYVTAGKALVSLQALDPLYVDFSLPEQTLPLLQANQKVQINIDAFPHENFFGTILATNSKVDLNTRTVQVRANLTNDQSRLYPGVFARVTVFLPLQQSVVVIPQTAVSYNLYGNIVYLVTPHGKDKSGKPILVVNQRFVTLGQRKQNEVVVLKGLKAGDEIVTAGQLKLHEGSRVAINNSVNITDNHG